VDGPNERRDQQRRAGHYRRVVLDQAAPPALTDEPHAEAAEGKQFSLGLVGVVAGVLVGAGIIGVLALSGYFATEDREANAQDELIAAYERNRGAVYAFDGEFTRTMPDGRQLVSGAFVVQRPPDELRRQLGGTSGRLNGRRVNCTIDPNDRFQCATAAEVGPWDEMVAEELDNLRSYFDPQAPAYTAERIGDGCFELRLVRAVADPPYGMRAVMCFDGPTGAMRSIEIEHESGVVDRLEADAVRSTVTNEDFTLEGQEEYDARDPGES
jgi:hypothetical protein